MVIDVTEETSLQALYRLAKEEQHMPPMPCSWLPGLLPPFKPMPGGRSYCVAEFRQCQESRRGKKVEVLGGFVWESASRKEVLT